jgi:hypothetical protein
MISDNLVIELRAILQAQSHLLQRLSDRISEIESKLIDVSQQSSQLQVLKQIMADLEGDIEFLEDADFAPDEIYQIYDRHQNAIKRDLQAIGFTDWQSFVQQCQIYDLQNGLDPLAPYEVFLTEADLQLLANEKKSYDAQFAWDKWDYLFVGASGMLAALTDVLLVGTPKTSPLTAWMKDFNTTAKAGQTDWFSQWARDLEKACKVPYDDQPTGMGMYPKSHRFQSLGHDPVLGFVFGVLDIMRGTVTGFSYDKLTGLHSFATHTVPKFATHITPSNVLIKLIEAILIQLGHLISDVATPSGLPAPFMTLIQGINIGSFGEKERSVGQVARWMYLNGYDLRHFITSGITPAAVEIVLRAYIMLRHYSEHGEVKFDLASHLKYRSMLLMAHGVATAANAGKVVLTKNPLAVNYAEYMAFIRYLIPSLKYWLFDKQHLRLEHMEKINESEWNDLLDNSDRLLGAIARTNFPVITLS